MKNRKPILFFLLLVCAFLFGADPKQKIAEGLKSASEISPLILTSVSCETEFLDCPLARTELQSSKTEVFCGCNIKELSDFRLLGERTIYSSPEFSDDAILYRTMNHEGGLNIRALRIGARDEAENGTWYFVILNAGVWAESGERVKAGEKFWIFISDDEDIFNYSES